MRPPGSVNLIAFPTRFERTCWRRAPSPITSMGSLLRSSLSSICLPTAATRSDSTQLATTSVRSTRASASSSFPDTMRETSSRSLMTCDCSQMFRSSVSAAREASSGSRPPVVRRMRTQPSMAFKGERSS